MTIKPVTMYQVVCDSCGKSADDGEFFAFSDPGGALTDAGWADWKQIEGKDYCPDCYEWDDEADEPRVREREK